LPIPPFESTTTVSSGIGVAPSQQGWFGNVRITGGVPAKVTFP
jgi:hypothetical protein